MSTWPTRPIIEFGYVRRFADASGPYLDGLDRPIDVLHVGGGGFTFPRYLEATRPGARQTVLELDPACSQVAREQLGFTPSDGIEVVVGDARRSIERLPDRLRSTSSSATRSAGWRCRGTSRRPSSSTRSSGCSGRAGCTSMNLIDYPPLGFVRAEAATAARRFDHVAVISGSRDVGRRERRERRAGRARRAPLDVAAVTARIATWGEADPTRDPRRPGRGRRCSSASTGPHRRLRPGRPAAGSLGRSRRA